MSDVPMTVPEGGESFRFAELMLYLPREWPLTDKALRDPNNSWPVQWLLKIARYPHENQTWLGGAASVIANGEPPRPLAPTTEMTCLLLLTEASERGWLQLSDGRRVAFYSMYPIYTEERDLEKAQGVEDLVRRFLDRGISQVVDVRRPNVATS
jgi:hypothetical protein